MLMNMVYARLVIRMDLWCRGVGGGICLYLVFQGFSLEYCSVQQLMPVFIITAPSATQVTQVLACMYMHMLKPLKKEKSYSLLQPNIGH